MPLRLRLIALVIVALSISLALGGAVTILNASRSVRTEMRSALLVGQQTVDNVVREIDASSDPQRDLDDLVASFKGSRHLRVSVTGAAVAAVQPANDRSPFGKVPAWFVRLIGVAPEATIIGARVSRAGDGAIQDADIIQATRFVFEQAELLHMPAVVNLSLGSDFGTHDGSSALFLKLHVMHE